VVHIPAVLQTRQPLALALAAYLSGVVVARYCQLLMAIVAHPLLTVLGHQDLLPADQQHAVVDQAQQVSLLLSIKD